MSSLYISNISEEEDSGAVVHVMVREDAPCSDPLSVWCGERDTLVKSRAFRNAVNSALIKQVKDDVLLNHWVHVLEMQDTFSCCVSMQFYKSTAKPTSP